MTRIAVVGGGPGGLFTAWHLASKAGSACDVTIFEAEERIGGKIASREFPGAGRYEAGLAEIYDYSGIGPDPLRHMIEAVLGLRTRPIAGGGCFLDGKLLETADDLALRFGEATRDAVRDFRHRCAAMLTPAEFYGSSMARDNVHPWAGISAETVLAEHVPDEQARRYLGVMMHSDLAAPLHQTDGLNALKNVVMDIPGFMSIYSIVGGNELIVRGLAEQIDAAVRPNMPVRAVRPTGEGTWRLVFGGTAAAEELPFDIVVLALPLNALSLVEWRDPDLHLAMKRHVAHFDRPGHYLRATFLFDAPFWRETIGGAWWMLDAFGGCCVYDEGLRQDGVRAGILGILVAGNAALELANQPDAAIRELCLEALPDAVRRGRHRMLDMRIHRWLASVNAIPGGRPVRSLARNHQPGGEAFPSLYVVGDYLFDSTLNGTLDSADAATDMIVASLVRRRGALATEAPSGPTPTFLDAGYLGSLLRSVGGGSPARRVLHLGGDDAALADGLRDAGFDAESLRFDAMAGAVPFAAGAFDAVVETCFHRVPGEALPALAAEIRRVCVGPLVIASPTTDLPLEMIERYRLLSPSHRLVSRWELSETLLEAGFDLSLADASVLARAWDATLAVLDAAMWFEDAEGLLYAVYAPRAPDADRRRELIAGWREAGPPEAEGR